MDLLTAMARAKEREGDKHRSRAYRRAADGVSRAVNFDRLLAEGRLEDIPGVGASIAKKIQAFAERDEVPEFVEEGDWETHVSDVDTPIPASFKKPAFRRAPDLHCHTRWSDGMLTIEEVVEFAERLGAEAIGISDHSGSLAIARGLKPDDVRAQWEEIDRIQKEHPDLTILKGTECDILRDGTLDHPKEILAGFDYVIGSLHSHLKLPEAEQTERVIKALECEHLTILGHPTTRIPGHRPPANLDLPRIFAKAADEGVALEVNGNPGRLDLDAKLAKQALAAGARISLSSDAHSAREMLALAKARAIAEEIGATEEQIVNFDFLSQ